MIAAIVTDDPSITINELSTEMDLADNSVLKILHDNLRPYAKDWRLSNLQAIPHQYMYRASTSQFPL